MLGAQEKTGREGPFFFVDWRSGRPRESCLGKPHQVSKSLIHKENRSDCDKARQLAISPNPIHNDGIDVGIELTSNAS